MNTSVATLTQIDPFRIISNEYFRKLMMNPGGFGLGAIIFYSSRPWILDLGTKHFSFEDRAARPLKGREGRADRDKARLENLEVADGGFYFGILEDMLGKSMEFNGIHLLEEGEE